MHTMEGRENHQDFGFEFGFVSNLEFAMLRKCIRYQLTRLAVSQEFRGGLFRLVVRFFICDVVVAVLLLLLS